MDKSSGRNYSIQHITEAYHNDINRWDFLQVRFFGVPIYMHIGADRSIHPSIYPSIHPSIHPAFPLSPLSFRSHHPPH